MFISLKILTLGGIDELFCQMTTFFHISGVYESGEEEQSGGWFHENRPAPSPTRQSLEGGREWRGDPSRTRGASARLPFRERVQPRLH